MLEELALNFPAISESLDLASNYASHQGWLGNSKVGYQLTLSMGIATALTFAALTIQDFFYNRKN